MEHRLRALVGKFAALLLLPLGIVAADKGKAQFAFAGPEIFPIETGISQLKEADLDGDGLNDIVVVNNARSKITLLYNQTGKTNDPTVIKERQDRDTNELPPDSRFRIQTISSEKRISSLLLTDLNHDKKPDIAYYGEPKELIIQYNEGTNKWSALKRVAIDDGSLDPYALVSGDLNGDKLADICLLADNFIYFIAQKPDGTLAEAERIPFIGSVRSIQILDIQGDGRDDLMLVNWDNPIPFRIRLQNASGKLGPEIHFPFPPIRSYWADDLNDDHKTEVVTIAQKSGRAQISTFTQKTAEELSGDWKEGQFQLMPLNKTSKTRRGELWADLNGDGRSDLLVADPEGGQLMLSIQKEDGSFENPQKFASLTGVTDLLANDWNEDGKPEIFLLSSDERQVGETVLDDKGGISFPKVIWMDGRPMVMAIGGLKYKGKTALASIVDLDGKKELQLRTAGGERFRQKLGENFKGTPQSMIIHDVDQDGLPDLVVLIPYEKIKVFLNVPDQDFKEIDVAAPGGNSDQLWVASADVDGDGKAELLLPQRNFLRAVVLKSNEGQNWNFQVKEQINGAASNSRIVAATELNGNGKTPALFLLDAERKALTLTERNEAGSWQVTRNISLPFTDFQSLEPITLNGGITKAISLSGLGAVGWLELSGKVWALTEMDGYETPIKDGFLHDVISGDLNGDGRKDLVFTETAKNYLDVVTFDEKGKVVPANRWQVFEERTFRSRRNDLAEPREAWIGDVTGDDKNDLAIIVHDRILVYPQE